MDRKLSHKDLSINSKRVFYPLVAYGVATIIFYGYVFIRYQIPQSLLAAGMILVITALAPWAYQLSRRGKVELAGVLLTLGMATAYGINEVVWSGLTPFHIAGGLLLIILSGSFVLPNRHVYWMVMAVFYLAVILIINWFEPVMRIDQADLPVLLPNTIGSIVLLVMVLAFQLVMQLQVTSIRTRLVLTFILLVLVPVSLTGVVLSYLNAQNAQQQGFNQLDLVLTLKEAELQSWLDSLKSTLNTAAPTEDEVSSYLILVDKTRNISESEYEAIIDNVRRDFQDAITNSDLFTEFFILDLNGSIVLSTDSEQVGALRVSREYFKKGSETTFITAPYRSPSSGEMTMVIAQPVFAPTGEKAAVLAGRINLGKLSQVFSTTLGETGEIYLVLEDKLLLTALRSGQYAPLSQYLPLSQSMIQAVEDKVNGKGLYDNYDGVPVLGVYRWIPEIKVVIIAEQQQSEVLQPIFRTLLLNVALMVVLVSLAVGAGLIATNRITAPMARLTETASHIAAGNLEVTADVGQLDEVGQLASSFNQMTQQIRQLVGGLEQNVAERTHDLEKRSSQLQIAAEVARDVLGVRDLDELLNLGINLIRERFGYYHVSVFLNDDRGENSVLKASTGEAGRVMLARGHRLPIGERGIVGYVSQTGRSRMAGDVRVDPIFYANPLLPDTRSEVALPLRAGAQTYGVIDVQSTEVNAFDEETVYILQIVSDQLAVAIQSARYLDEISRALNELENVYSSYTRQSWRVLHQHKSGIAGYRYHRLGLTPIFGSSEPDGNVKEAVLNINPVVASIPADDELEENQVRLTTPLVIRGQAIGALQVQFEGNKITQDVIETYQEIAGRLSLVLENARLLQEAQGLARREQRISLVANQIRNSINLESILQNTVRELGREFGASRTFVRLGFEENDGQASDSQALSQNG